MSHYGYYMGNLFNKYLLRVYYTPGGKFNDSFASPESRPNVTALYK